MRILAEELDEPGLLPVPEGFWSDVWAFFGELGEKALLLLVVLIVTVVVALLLRLVIGRLVDHIVRSAKSKAAVDDTQAIERSPLANMRLVQRTRTLGTILRNIVNVALGIIAIAASINILAPSLLGSLTLLTAAIGAGLGFGAQNIVKDVLNGIFIVAEDQIGIGDVVDLGPASGVVEYVSVRITQVRDVNGTLWYVRNGEIVRIGNLSQGWARAIVDLAVPSDADLDVVENAVLEAAQGLAEDPKWRTRVIEQPEVWGLESVEGDALVVRVVLKTRAHAKGDVARQLRLRLRRAILDLGLEVPALKSVMPEGLDAAFRVRGANPPKTRPATVVDTRAPVRGIWRRKKSGEGSPAATVDRESDAAGNAKETQQ